jgi:hypothetical protein
MITEEWRKGIQDPHDTSQNIRTYAQPTSITVAKTLYNVEQKVGKK